MLYMCCNVSSACVVCMRCVHALCACVVCMCCACVVRICRYIQPTHNTTLTNTLRDVYATPCCNTIQHHKTLYTIYHTPHKSYAPPKTAPPVHPPTIGSTFECRHNQAPPLILQLVLPEVDHLQVLFACQHVCKGARTSGCDFVESQMQFLCVYMCGIVCLHVCWCWCTCVLVLVCM